MCTRDSHEKMKADPQRFATECEPIGTMDAGEGCKLQLANCKQCCSTLALVVRS